MRSDPPDRQKNTSSQTETWRQYAAAVAGDADIAALGSLVADPARARILLALGEAATVIDEVHGFRSFDQRDLLGFVDGTENPEGQAATEAVLVGHEDGAFAGGSYVVVQKYAHDLAAWGALTVEQQERIIGRTKLADLELSNEDKPPDSHLALTVIETMLRNMFLGTAEAAHDRILDFSTAVTGTLFFVPPVAMLDDGPAAATTTTAAAPAAAPPKASDPPAADGEGSLRLGGLRPPR
jgi:putative iron-dependent peroxidase